MFQCSWRPFYNPLFTIRITQSKYNNNDKQTKKNLLTFLKNRIWPNTTDLDLYLSLYLISQSSIKSLLSQIALALFYFALWLFQKKGHSLNQSDAKPKPVTPWSLAFSRALRSLLLFYYTFSLARYDICIVLIGCCHDFGFSLTRINRKALNSSKDSVHVP